MNSPKEYRILPIFLMNYDLSADGGIVRYTEKERGIFKEKLIETTNEYFKIKLKSPKCMLITWDDMKSENSTLCYQVREELIIFYQLVKLSKIIPTRCSHFFPVFGDFPRNIYGKRYMCLMT